MNATALPYDRMADVLHRWARGQHPANIADRCGLDVRTVASLLRLGGANPPLRRAYRMRQLGHGPAAVARTLGVCQSTVTGWLQKLGLGEGRCSACEALAHCRGKCWPCHFATVEEYRLARQLEEAAQPTDEERRQARLPCPHPPGSAGKVECLRLRVACRAPLFVRGDAGTGGLE